MKATKMFPKGGKISKFFAVILLTFPLADLPGISGNLETSSSNGPKLHYDICLYVCVI